MANIYCTATNPGKGFITIQDYISFFPSGHPGDVWVVGDNSKGAAWINRVSGTAKTKAEAQAIADKTVDEAIVAWEAFPANQPHSVKPEKYILP